MPVVPEVSSQVSDYISHLQKVDISAQGGLADRSLHDRMQTIEGQLAAIAASGSYMASMPLEWTSASANYPVPPADYIVYDHTTESAQNPFPSYDTASNCVLSDAQH